MMKAPMSTARVGDPGMPRVSSGTIAAFAYALLAVSGEATPSMTPVPNLSGCFETFFYAQARKSK